MAGASCEDVGRKLMRMFDIICVVMTTRPKIKNYTLRTLQKLGVLTTENVVGGKVHIQYDMPNAARRIVKRNVKNMNECNRRDSVFWCTLNHYYALAAAYHSGAEHALVLEDDAAVLKDPAEALKYLDGVPDGYDLVNFGCLPTGGPGGVPNFRKMLEAPGGTELYARLVNGRSSHAFGMSRRFMEKMLLKIEDALEGDGTAQLLVNDQWFNSRIFPGFGLWFSRKPLFVQQWDGTSKCGSGVYCMFYDLYADCSKDDYDYQTVN